jgi:hypothetical protein
MKELNAGRKASKLFITKDDSSQDAMTMAMNLEQLLKSW